MIKDSHFLQIQSGKSQSVPATQQGVTAGISGRDTFQKSQPEISKAQGIMGTNQMHSAVTGGNMASGAMGGSFGAVNIGTMSMGNANFGSITDIDQLVGLLSQNQSNQGQNMQAMGAVNQQSMQQMNANSMTQKSMQHFGQMEQKFGAQEMQYKTKEMTFKATSKVLDGVSTALTTASQALNAAAQSIEAVASAVAAIPCVGAAISAALRAVAQVLKAMAKMLKTLGDKMKQMSQKMMQQANQMKAQKLMNQAKKLQEQQKLSQGMQQLQKIMNEREKLQEHMNASMNQQMQILQRLQELGQNVQGGGRAALAVCLEALEKNGGRPRALPGSRGPEQVGQSGQVNLKPVCCSVPLVFLLQIAYNGRGNGREVLLWTESMETGFMSVRFMTIIKSAGRWRRLSNSATARNSRAMNLL